MTTRVMICFLLSLTCAARGQGQEVKVVGPQMREGDMSQGQAAVQIPVQVVSGETGHPLPPDQPMMVESSSGPLVSPEQKKPLQEEVDPGDHVDGGEGVVVEETIEEEEVGDGRHPLDETPLEQQLHDMFGKDGQSSRQPMASGTTAAHTDKTPRSLTIFWIILITLLVINMILIIVLGIATERKRKQGRRPISLTSRSLRADPGVGKQSAV